LRTVHTDNEIAHGIVK